MTQLDQILSRIRDLPPDPRLSAIDASVFDGIAAVSAQPALPRAAFGMTFAIALSVGVLGAALPSPQAETTPLFPLGATGSLAPSSLLSGAHE